MWAVHAARRLLDRDLLAVLTETLSLVTRRTHKRASLRHVGAKKYRNQFGDSYGVKGKSILGALPGIRFPWSFPPDVMHLFYENVIPRIIKHYRGVFYMADTGTDTAPVTGSDSVIEGAVVEDRPPRPGAAG